MVADVQSDTAQSGGQRAGHLTGAIGETHEGRAASLQVVHDVSRAAECSDSAASIWVLGKNQSAIDVEDERFVTHCRAMVRNSFKGRSARLPGAP